MTQNAPSLSRFKAGDLIERVEAPKEFRDGTFNGIELYAEVFPKIISAKNLFPTEMQMGKVALILTQPAYLSQNEKWKYFTFGRPRALSHLIFDVLYEGKKYTAVTSRKTYESFIRKIKNG